jgi:S1-C subfamily serine protease
VSEQSIGLGPHGEARQRGFAHAVALVLVVVIAALIVVAVEGAPKHRTSINPAALTKALGPSIALVTAGGPAGAAVGSGIVVAPDQVVTAAGLVDAANAITIATAGVPPTPARLVGYDRAAEIALLALSNPNAARLPAAPVDGRKRLRVNDNAVALGNPTGIAAPVASAGSIRRVDDALLTVDTPVRVAEIGGAIVNSERDVVGMITGFTTATTTTARPIDAVMAVVQAIDRGQTTASVHVGPRASLGVGVVPLTSSAGVRVTATEPGEHALHIGDVVASVAGIDVSSQTDIDRALDAHAPGDTVSVAMFDGRGVLHTVSVPLTAA